MQSPDSEEKGLPCTPKTRHDPHNGNLQGISIRYNGGLHVQTDDSRAVEVKKGLRRRVLPKPDTLFQWGGQHVLDHRGLIHFLSTAGRISELFPPSDPSEQPAPPSSLALSFGLLAHGLALDNAVWIRSGGMESWTNPADSGALRVRGSPWAKGRIEDVVISTPHTKSDSWSEDAPDAWVSIELPTGLLVDPCHYTIRHGYGGGAQLKNWQV